MNTRLMLRVAAMSCATFLAGGALAADASTSLSQMQSGPSPGGSIQGAIDAGPQSVGGTERFDNSNGVPLTGALREYAQEHGGRLPVVFVDEDGTRWRIVHIEAEPAAVNRQARIVYLTPDVERTIAVAPAEGQVIYLEPGGAQVIYVVPDDEDALVAPGPGGMQATPGEDGPNSPKAE
jgi:hypothetical protein